MAYIASITDTNSNTYDIKSKVTEAIPFGTVNTTSTATAFTATVDGITELSDGVCVYLNNGVVTSASGATLNINSLGAKPIYLANKASTRVTTEFKSTVSALFVYNTDRVATGCWDMVVSSDEPTTYTLSISSNVITLTGSDSSTSSITLPVYSGSVS